MLFNTLSVAFFAALASAHAHHPQHFHHRRQLNTTSALSGESTTLTVFATEIHTVTSCAPTVTNCPASTAPAVVTDIIAITTTVCPVEQAESASSAAHASYSATAVNSAAGVVITPTVPLGTGNSGPAPTGSASGEESVVLTYTLGSGTSTTVVTTTIKHTSTATVYATIPGEGGAASVTGSNEGNVDAELTTTLTGTSTSTKYITVMAAPSAAVSAGGVIQAGASGAAGCVPVTVTVALSTVTVTETATPAGDSAAGGAVTSVPVKDNNVADPSTTDGPVVILSTQTVQPLPVTTAPYGNGTDSGVVSNGASSGFISKIKPTALPSGY